MNTLTKKASNKEITVKLFDNGMASVTEKAINPKTGKGWQASRNTASHDNHKSAMWDWCKRK